MSNNTNKKVAKFCGFDICIITNDVNRTMYYQIFKNEVRFSYMVFASIEAIERAIIVYLQRTSGNDLK